MLRSKKQALLLINLTSILLGFSGLFAKWIDLPALVIIGGRSLVAVPLLLVLTLVVSGYQRIRSRKDILVITVCALLLTMHWVFFYYAIQVSTVSIGIISVFTYPVITACIEPFFGRVAWKKRHVIKGLFISIGVGVLSFHPEELGQVCLGIGLGLLSAISFAIRNCMIKQIVTHYSSVFLMTLQVCLSLGLLLPFTYGALVSATLDQWKLIVIVGLGITVVSHTCFIKCMERLSATTVGIIASFQIVYAVIAGWIFLGESLSFYVICGGGIVMSVVYLEHKHESLTSG